MCGGGQEGPDDQESKRLRRQQLTDLQARAQDAYDQTLFKLSGGALGLSFIFLRQIAGDQPRLVWAVWVSWSLWLVSLACVLWSHHTSARAMDRAIEQLDTGNRSDGGPFDKWTAWLNPIGGIAFVLAAVSAGIFMITNLGGDE